MVEQRIVHYLEGFYLLITTKALLVPVIVSGSIHSRMYYFSPFETPAMAAQDKLCWIILPLIGVFLSLVGTFLGFQRRPEAKYFVLIIWLEIVGLMIAGHNMGSLLGETLVHGLGLPISLLIAWVVLTWATAFVRDSNLKPNDNEIR